MEAQFLPPGRNLIFKIVWINFRFHTYTTIAVLKRYFLKGMFVFMGKNGYQNSDANALLFPPDLT
jgi:hypothetical protein